MTSFVEPFVPAGIMAGRALPKSTNRLSGVTIFCSAMNFENAAGASLTLADISFARAWPKPSAFRSSGVSSSNWKRAGSRVSARTQLVLRLHAAKSLATNRCVHLRSYRRPSECRQC